MKNWYYRISIIGSFIAVVGYLWSMKGPFSPASDGSGPDPRALLAVAFMWVTVALLIHSTLLGLYCYLKNDLDKWKLATSALLWGLFMFPHAQEKIVSIRTEINYRKSATYRIQEAVKSKNTSEVTQIFMEQSPQEKEVLLPSLILDAISMGRVDILTALKSIAEPVITPKSEKEWADLIVFAVREQNISPQAKLATVQWLVNEGVPFSYSLNSYSYEVFQDFSNYFRNPKDPSTAKLFDLLTSHGAAVNSCRHLCPLWYAARFRNLDHVKFLVSKGANVNQIDVDHGTSPLGEAIQNSHLEIIETLLKAGAKTHPADIEKFCAQEMNSEVIALLKKYQKINDNPCH